MATAAPPAAVPVAPATFHRDPSVGFEDGDWSARTGVRMTLAKFAALPEAPDVTRYLIDGEVWEYPMTTRSRPHASCENLIGTELRIWLREHLPGGDVGSGEVAVPAAMLIKEIDFKHKLEPTTKLWPPNKPAGARGPYLWVDANGNADYDANEFQPLPYAIDLMQVDARGHLWGIDDQHVFRIPYGGISPAGVPRYDAAALEVYDMSDRFEKVTRFSYQAEGDAAFVTGFAKGFTPSIKKELNVSAGNLVVRLDGITTGTPDEAWRLAPPALPYRVLKAGHHRPLNELKPVGVHAVGDHLFVMYDRHSQPEAGGYPAIGGQPDIRVYRTDDAAPVGVLQPGDAIGGRTGLLDFGQHSASFQRLRDGRYLIFTEDYLGGKQAYYLWRPSGR